MLFLGMLSLPERLCGYDLITPAGEAAVRQIARGEPFARAWIMRRDAHAAATSITLSFRIEYGGRDGFIDDLYLIPEVRGHRLGRQLLHFALAETVRLGIAMLHLEVKSGNERANRLHRSAGF